MSRYPFRLALAVLASALLAACGRESPTSVGGPLLPGGSLRTFELILDAPQFLAGDTSVVGFVRPGSTAFEVVAQGYGGSVTAHTLARFGPTPIAISVRDSTGVSVTDTLPKWFAGNLVVKVDTLALTGGAPVTLQLYRTAQSWDQFSAGWTMRVDSGSTHLPWTTPGGTTAGLVDTATWSPGSDSLIFHVDSATMAQWNDTSNAGRGALIAAATAGSRLRLRTVYLSAQAHSSIRKDTVVSTTLAVSNVTFIYNPPVSFTPGQLLVGGVPAWRSFVTIAPDLETRTFSCPASSGITCSFTLKQVTVNFAGLELQAAPPGAFAPEDSVRLAAWVSDTAGHLPLTRAPLGVQLGGTAPAYAPTLFAGTPATTVSLPITLFMSTLAGDTTHAGRAPIATRRIAVLQVPEPGLFGVARFYGRTAGALAPKLRLIVTLAAEAQLP